MQTVRTTKTFGRKIVLASATIAVIPFALGGAILVSPRAANAEVTTFSTSNRTYKVGILLIDSTTDPLQPVRGAENPDPFVFYIADQRLDLKPAGWNLENPLAPSTVTTDVFTRWSGVGGRDPNHPYSVGQKVTKDMAAYWEVSLTKSTLEELLQFDILFITNHRLTNFTPQDREKLRKVVDAGGVVWMDDCGGMRIGPSSRFFLEDIQFQGNVGGISPTTGPVIVQPAHPLLNSPYTLSFADIQALGDKNYGNYFMSSFKANPVNINDTVLTAPNKETLTTIIGNKAQKDVVTNQLFMPFIAAGVYGSGGVIVSSADIGCGVNDYSGGSNAGSGGNSGAYAGKNLLAANAEDLKFTYNAIVWGGANNTVRRNNRRVASASSAVSAPLNPAFSFTALDPNRVQSNSSPLIYQGIMYVSGVDASGAGVVVAYDTVPNRDYDNDGNNDDGIPDLIKGAPYDEIWRSPVIGSLAVQPSSPVLANVTIGGASRPVILITQSNGNVVMLDAKPTDPATGRLLPSGTNYGVSPATATGGATYTNAANGVAPAPVFFGNKIYAVEPTGAIVRCIDAGNNLTNFANYEWKSTMAAGSFQYAPTGSPTLGLNRLVTGRTTGNGGSDNNLAGNTNESTNDVMLYVPVLDTTDLSNLSSKLLPFWLGSRGEGNKVTNFDGTDNTISFRPAGTEANNVFMSKGKDVDPLSPFVGPSQNLKLYADVTLTVGGDVQTYTREENFAAGRAVYPQVDPFFSNLGYPAVTPWKATFQPSPINGAFYNGKVAIEYTGDATMSRVSRVLAVADYDTVYVPGDGSPEPTNLTSQPGHRNVAPLTIPGGTGLDTAAFSPDDLLMYGANQSGTVGAFAGLFALQEREYSRNSSRLRWHYLLHDGYTGATVGTDTVSDLPALRNRLRFTGGFDTAQLYDVAPYYEKLTGAQIVGSPITTNDGVTYFLARAQSGLNGTVTVLMAFQTAPQITLDLGVPLEDGSTVTVSQYDPLTGDPVTITGNNNDRARIDTDYATGKVTVADFRRADDPKQTFSASSTFLVKYTQKGAQAADGGQPTKPFTPFGNLPNVQLGQESEVLGGATGSTSTSGGFSPMLWYYVLPGNPNGAPVKIGDQIFLTIGGELVAVDADPVSNDPTVRVRSGEQVYNVVNKIASTANPAGADVDRPHVRWHSTLPTAPGSGSPSGDEGVVAVNTTAGTVAYSEGLTLVSDNTRIMEVNADGAAVWVTDATEDRKIIGGEQPVYAADGTLLNAGAPQGVQTSKAQGFSSPRSVRRLGSSDYLVADTGNNRVVRFDKGAVLRWSVSRVVDPYGVLAPGDPLTLDAPSDVLTRRLRTFDTTNALIGYEDHYIIADTGNSRVLDVVDYYDLNGQPREVATGISSGVVVWTTRTKSSGGQNLAYNKLQLLGSNIGGISGKPVLVASVSNTGVAAGNNDKTSNSGNGSLVQLDYNPRNTGFVLVNAATGAFDSIGRYWSDTIPEPANNGKPLLAINELRSFDPDGAGGIKINTKPLNAPSYFEEIPLDIAPTVLGAEKVYLIADSDGVYLATIRAVPSPSPATQGPKSYFDVIWRFGQGDYDAINNGRLTTLAGAKLPSLSAASVKRLANGDFLITNSAAQSSALFESGRFTGEVFGVKPIATILGATNLNTDGTVKETVVGGTFGLFSAPKIIKGTGVLNKQQMGRDANGTTLTEQPRSADRL